MSKHSLPETQNAVFRDMESAFCEPGHPAFHLTAPSHFTIDFWGAIRRNSLYHIFYHVCEKPGPFQEETVFFHSQSKNLIDWEMLPVPILPRPDELRMNDGCICIDGNNTPVMLYTSVPEDDTIPRTHCAAHGTDDLLSFERKIPEPFLTLENHGGPVFQNGWSDPFVFQANGRTFLLMSKCVTPDGDDPMPIYEATDDTMLHWEYKGIFYEHNGEVINFFPLGSKWVLIYSPYSTPEYFVGSFDLDTCRFIPERHDFLSYGYHKQSDPFDRGFYATCIYPEEHRTVLCGWISGFQSPIWWDGCMGIPRVLGLNEHLQLTQCPIPEFDALRGEVLQTYSAPISETESPVSDCMELCAEFTTAPDGETTFQITSGGNVTFTLCVAADSFSCNESHYPCKTTTGSHRTLRLLIDRTVAEVFLDDGTLCATCCFAPLEESPTLRIFCTGDSQVQNLTCWKITPCQITVSPLVSAEFCPNSEKKH